MLHESSFASSAFTSSSGQRLPPGFTASSLDFKSRAASKRIANNDVTTKPGINKKDNKRQQEEYLEREKQDKQRRQYRPRHPTRAQGNFGPPPHSIDSLKDLENMSEEEIYKLFTEDPNFHQALLEATEKEKQETITAPTSAPIGAKKGRRSTERKQSSKANQNTRKTKKLSSRDVERDIPYLQWLFLFILIGAAIYKTFKSGGTPIATKAFGGISKKAMRRKQKIKKGKKSETNASTRKNNPEDNANQKISTPDEATVKKKSSSRRKKKKSKASTSRSMIISEDSEKGDANHRTENGEENSETNLETIDGSSGNHVSEITKSDIIIQVEPDTLPISNDNDETWQKVTKSSKGIRKEKILVDPKPVEEKKGIALPAAQHIKDDGDSVGLKENTSNISPKKHVGETNLIINEDKTEKKILANENINTDIEQTITAKRKETDNSTEKHNMASKVHNSKNANDCGKQKLSSTTDNDAALALKLQAEEMKNLTRAANSNREEEIWEEVTIKKRRA